MKDSRLIVFQAKRQRLPCEANRGWSFASTTHERTTAEAGYARSQECAEQSEHLAPAQTSGLFPNHALVVLDSQNISSDRVEYTQNEKALRESRNGGLDRRMH